MIVKELSIEEKAKRYDEVVNKLKGFMAQGVDPLITRADAQDFFPELKESEDERIRKSLVTYFANFKPDYMWDDDFSFGDIVAWLEKQGGHAKFINGIQVGDKVTRNEDGVLFNLSQLNRVAKKDEKQGEQKLTELTNSQFVEKCKGLSDLEKYILSLVPTRPIDAIKVDARTVRYLVEQEQKPAWSEEDERMMMFCCDYLDDNQKSWLLSLKEKVQPQPKQEWDEIDMDMLESIIKDSTQRNSLDPMQLCWLDSLTEKHILQSKPKCYTK